MCCFDNNEISFIYLICLLIFKFDFKLILFISFFTFTFGKLFRKFIDHYYLENVTFLVSMYEDSLKDSC